MPQPIITMKYFVLLLVFSVLIISGCVNTTEKPDTQEAISQHEVEKKSEKEIVNPAAEKSDHPETQPENYQKKYTQPKQSPLFTDSSQCEEKDAKFTFSPIDIDIIRIIEPQGELTDITSGHITPGDHIGIQYPQNGGPYELFAMADGFIARMERQPSSPLFGLGKDVENLHVYFEYSCNLFGSYVHVTKLTDELVNSNQKLKEFYTKERPTNTESLYERIPVKAGQQIGEVEGFGLFGMLTVDTNVNLPGFVTPEIYEGEPWKTHSVAPFDYFVEPIKGQLLAKNARKVEPVGGKIDFDVPGRLSGNWFLKGTTYAGNQKGRGYCGNYLCPYWDTHLAFVYDFVDPNQVRISIGYDTGIPERGPFGIKQVPDPKSVSVSTGLVKYDLVQLEDISAEYNIVSQGKAVYTRNSDKVVGTMFVQMTGEKTIKVEVFPGKTSSQISGFTEKAKIYER